MLIHLLHGKQTVFCPLKIVIRFNLNLWGGIWEWDLCHQLWHRRVQNIEFKNKNLTVVLILIVRFGAGPKIKFTDPQPPVKV